MARLITLSPVLLMLMIPYGLTTIGLALKSHTQRQAVFILNLGVILYIIRYATMGLPSSDYSVGSGLATLVFAASDFLLLSDPHVDLHMNGQVITVNSLPFLDRLKWAIHLVISPRLIGWSGQSTVVSAPPRPNPTKSDFLFEQFSSLAVEVLVLDVLGITMSRTPAFSVNGPRLVTYGWVSRSLHTIHLTIGMYTGLDAIHRTWFLTLMATGSWMPADFRPLFGSWRDMYTLRTFWGKAWHQLHRRKFIAHGRFLAHDVLRIPRRGRFSLFIQLYTAFLVSRLIHYAGDYMALRHWGGGSLHFFLIQPISIYSEGLFLSLARRLAFGESEAWKVLGYLWVWQWFTWCLPTLFDPLLEGGLIEYMPKLGIMETVWSKL